MIDIDEILTRGGRARIDFLRYCVMSINIEPVFLFLAGEYRLRPAHAAALALFDLFCAADAPARLTAHELLPPRELGLGLEIARIRESWAELQTPPSADDEEPRPVPPWPGRALFDALVRGVHADTHVRLAELATRYDPQRSPHENLPGGKLSTSQRQFVERVWTPIVRPRLTAAGFWQIATVG